MSVFDKSRVRDHFWEMIVIYYELQNSFWLLFYLFIISSSVPFGFGRTFRFTSLMSNSCWLLYCAELLHLFSKLKMMNVSFILELSLITQIQLHRLNDKFINNSIMIAIML